MSKVYGQGPPAQWPPGPDMTAKLDPPTTYQRSQERLAWYQTQVFYPTPWFPASDTIGLQPRRRPMQPLLNAAVGTTVIRTIQIDIPYVVYAFTGGAVNSDGSALPNGMNPLDTFTVQFVHNTGDRLDTLPALASCLIGTAAQPCVLGGNGWNFDRGGTIQILVTPLRQNLRIDVCTWGIEVRGPVNYNVQG